MKEKQRNAFKVLLFLLSIAITNLVKAESDYVAHTVVFFGNGILTTKSKADNSLRVLEQDINQIINDPDQAQDLLFKLAYNQTNALLDLVEAFNQYVQTNYSQFWRMLAGLEEISDTSAGTFLGILSDNIAQILESNTLEENPAVQRHVDMYNKLLRECKRVVVVAHSQGNFFANIAYAGIDPDLVDAFGIVSVANPDSEVKGGGMYTTMAEDLVINPIPGALPWNVDNYGFFELPNPWYGHHFRLNYLHDGGPAKMQIIDHLQTMIERVRRFDNTDYCGWPAIYANNSSLFRAPYDREVDQYGRVTSEVWDDVWRALQHNKITVQYKLATMGNWVTLSLQNGSSSYAYYDAAWGETEESPHFFFNNTSSSLRRTKTIEIQPRDVTKDVPYGLQTYRILVDGKVAVQFSLDYDRLNWYPAKASRPIADPLLPGSQPIEPIR